MRMTTALAILGLTTGAAPGMCDQSVMIRADRSMLCVTEGALQETSNHRLSVNVPKMRAYFNRASEQTISADFTYLGPTESEEPLGSGQMRQQFGLKLLAEDACNLVYAMWRIKPDSTLVVSIKSNPGQHTSAECGNRGYRNIKPLQYSPVPLLHPGDRHQLRANLNGKHLRVFVDEAIVWDGSVGNELLKLVGPVGIRSDNVKLEFELRVGRSSGTIPSYVLGCRTTPEL